MEPDHCANIDELLLRYPNLKIVGNPDLPMIQQFYRMDLTDKTVTVKEGDTLCLGTHTLRFFMAPMVHWPEVMVTYDETDKILFSADAFGTFGALNGNIFNDEVAFDRDWLPDARRYYSNIVGKYGAQVQAALKNSPRYSDDLPLHGEPVWRNDLAYLLGKYDLWSRYGSGAPGIAILHASMWHYGRNAANRLPARPGGAGPWQISRRVRRLQHHVSALYFSVAAICVRRTYV